jgi:penicillin-binding protein 1A
VRSSSSSRAGDVCRDCDERIHAGRRQTELSMEEILGGAQRRPYPGRPGSWTSGSTSSSTTSSGRDQARHGRRALVLERGDIAGKTGTTNGPVDAWFSGYNPDVVTTTWVGFDDYGSWAAVNSAAPRPCRSGSATCARRWTDCRSAARLPPGISYVRIDPDTGLLAPGEQRNAIFEYFRTTTCPPSSEDNGGHGPAGHRRADLIQEIF